MSAATSVNIAGRLVGPGNPCFIIAEIAQAHDGSLGTAHAYIDAVASAGVDAVKFQTHIAEAESSAREPFRVDGFPQDVSRYDYWRRMEFAPSQWAELAAHAKEAGLVFLSTPFSLEAAAMLEEIRMPAWKIGSGDISTLPLLERVAATGSPVLLSSGMSTWSELDEAVRTVQAHGAPLAIFQCTTDYPCRAEQIGLNVLGEISARYGAPVGLSDHSGDIFASLAAVTLGANLIEVHAVFSRDCYGPDVDASVTIGELGRLVEGVRFVERALSVSIDKDRAAHDREALRVQFSRSLVAARDLPAGHVLAEKDICFKKPGSGIPARRVKEFIGRTLSQAYAADDFLEEESFE